ncbi:hypothetical protein HYV86_04185 [Candidatus Woesearchaeota archaeon]|nr:hypothetical protein [Candidatus Woesearchaeota archaeon]
MVKHSKKVDNNKHKTLFAVLGICLLVAVAAFFFSGRTASTEEGAFAGQAVSLAGSGAPITLRYVVASCNPAPNAENPTGIAVVEKDGKTMRGYQNACAGGKLVNYTCNADGKSYQKATKSCDAGLVCSAGQCIPAVCQGNVAANSVLCAGDDAGLARNTNRVLVGACTDATKCEYVCAEGRQLLLNRVNRRMECQVPGAGIQQGLLSCSNVPVNATPCLYNATACAQGRNATECIPDNTRLGVNSARDAVVVANISACTVGRKCEYTCNAGFVAQNGVCVVAPVVVAPFCRWLPANTGAETEQGVFRNTCVDGQNTVYSCAWNSNQLRQNLDVCRDGLGCNADGVNCCRTDYNNFREVAAPSCNGTVLSRSYGTTCDRPWVYTTDCNRDSGNGRVYTCTTQSTNPSCGTCGGPVCSNMTGGIYAGNITAGNLVCPPGVNREAGSPTGDLVTGPGCP